MEFTKEQLHNIAVANINEIPGKRLDINKKDGKPTLTLPVGTHPGKVADDLKRIGLNSAGANHPQLEEGFHTRDTADASKAHIIVHGEDAIKKLAEAGVTFPGAELFAPEKQWARSV